MTRISTFAERLKAYIKENDNITYEELSKKTNIPAQTLNRYALGKRVPKVDQATDIALKLGVNPLWLQGFDVPKYEDIYNESEFYISELEKDFITDYRKYFKVKQLGEPQREELMLDIELLKYFHCLNTNGKKSVITAARGFCIESDYVNAERLQETLA